MDDKIETPAEASTPTTVPAANQQSLPAAARKNKVPARKTRPRQKTGPREKSLDRGMKRIRRARNRRSTIWRRCGTIPSPSAACSNRRISLCVAVHTGPYEEHMLKLQQELLKAQRWIESTGERVVMLFEGRDAAGKGGTIKRYMEHMNPRTARVVALQKPTERESSQWYFQRYISQSAGRRRNLPVRPLLV